jgi:hypothetical protein
MPLEGRTERRVLKPVAVYLMIAEKPLPAEQAMSVNVSPHGVRLRTKRRWKPGERARLATEWSGFHVEASVVYCEPLPDGRFAVGLEFRTGVINWGDAWKKPHAVAERPRSGK